MRSVALITLLAFVAAQEELAVNDSHSSVDDFADHFLNKLANKLADRALEAPQDPASIQQSDLDNAALAKVHLDRSPASPMTKVAATAPVLAGRSGGLMCCAPEIQSRAGGFAYMPQALHSSARPLTMKRDVTANIWKSSGKVASGSTYVVEQPKPIGVSFQDKGKDGIFVKGVTRDADPKIKVGDKLVAVSASFGGEIWPAKSYQQTMFALNTRIGLVYMKFESTGRVQRGAANQPLAQHVCLDCGWIYNQMPNDATFQELPRSFICPQCQAGKRRFARKNMETGDIENKVDIITIGTYATVVGGLVGIGLLTYIALTVA